MKQPTLLAAIGAIALAGCASSRPASGTIAHVVYFDLKDPAHGVELIADCDRDLSSMRGVRSYLCGRHHDIGRPNVDAAYDVGLVLQFASERDYRTYLDHPRHQALVAKWKPRWDSIHIYDTLDQP